MLRVLIVLAVLAGASAGAWFLVVQREPGPPAVPTSPGTQLGLSVRWVDEQPWMCASAEVAAAPSINITMTQARARTRALLAQASLDAQRALLERVRQGADGLPDLGDPWAALPDGLVSQQLGNTRAFDEPGDVRAGRSTQALPWQAVVAQAAQACARLELDEADSASLQTVLDDRAEALAADADALAEFWSGSRL